MVEAGQTPALPDPSGGNPGDGYIENVPADWTSYSAGKPTTEWVMLAAEDPSTSADILGMLAENCNVEVRMAVADNPTASLETLTMLAQDENDDLRFQLAENHNIDESVLRLLAEDAHPYVAHRAQKTIARLSGGATLLYCPLPAIAPIVSITRFASTKEP